MLLRRLRPAVAAGHTLLVADNDLDLVRAADRVTELGPGSGPEGGRVIVAGTAGDLEACAESPTGAALPWTSHAAPGGPDGIRPRAADARARATRRWSSRASRTHNLRGVDVAIPRRRGSPW